MHHVGPSVHIETTPSANSSGSEKERLRSGLQDTALNLTLEEKVVRLAIVKTAGTHAHEPTKFQCPGKECHPIGATEPPCVVRRNGALNALDERIQLSTGQATV